MIVDPLAHFLRAENEARTILELLLPLRTLTARGMAVLLLHHPKKGHALPGQAGRGHGALLGHVDNSIEMRHAGADLDTRARRFFTPFHATPTRRGISCLNGPPTRPITCVCPTRRTKISRNTGTCCAWSSKTPRRS